MDDTVKARKEARQTDEYAKSIDAALERLRGETAAGRPGADEEARAKQPARHTAPRLTERDMDEEERRYGRDKRLVEEGVITRAQFEYKWRNRSLL